jgi:amino acid adenylation domain-containing protein
VAEPRHDLPLSAPQRAMLVQRQFHPAHHDRFSGAFAWQFPAPGVDPDALRRAVDLLVQRHPLLRARFRLAPQPAADIGELRESPFRVEHLQASGPAAGCDQESYLDARLPALAAVPFDLATGPLLRCTQLQLGSGGSVVLLVVHHLACDSWSAGVLAEDLEQLYPIAAGTPLPARSRLPAPLTHEQLAAALRRRPAATAAAETLRYWAERLGGAEIVDLPADRPRPAVPSGRGATVRVRVPEAVYDGLRAVIRTSDSTLFMVGLAAFQVLVARYASASEVSIGVPVADRDDPLRWRLVGMLANTVVIRTELRAESSFLDLVKHVREHVLTALEHADVHFDEVVAALNPRREAARNPLFQLMFAVDRTAPLRLGEQLGMPILLDRDLRMHDLSMTLTEHRDSWYVQLQYDVDCFDRSRVERLAANYGTLLAAVAADPTLPVSSLPLISKAERKLLRRWAGGLAPAYSADAPVHGLVEEVVDQLPETPAVEFGDEILSYRQLDARANALAHRLRARGVQRGDVVGVYTGRSAWLVVALLGVWKAGAGYLPLDPSYPSRRLAFMCADARVRVVVSDDPLAFESAGQLTVAPLAGAGERARTDRPLVAVGSEDLAYLIYTSGSTGRPKAVAVPHRAVVSAFHAWDQLYALPRDGARYPQIARFSFDNSVGEFVRPLCSGGTVVLCSRDELRDPDAFLAYLARVRPYLMDVVPSVLRMAQRSTRYRDVLPTLGLRHLAIGGEPWSVAEAEELRALLPGCRLLNVYGLTEATVDSTFHVVSGTEPGPGLPIGLPLAHARIYVRDDWGRPVPVGVPGELCVGGPGLAWGYVNQPALTAQRFTPDPYGSPGSRTYRTGDRARFNPDGGVALLGRGDRQVKVRGFRVELGEVEAALAACPGVRRGVVELRAGNGREPVIVAYVVADPGLTLTALRGRLRTSLPGYMLPAAMVRLAQMPLLPNGKLDRTSLPDPEVAPAQAPLTAQADPLLRELAEIWSEALSQPVTDPQESFFGLGGTSLLAIQVVAQVRERMGKQLPFTALFEHQTLAAFSDACRAAPESADVVTSTAAPDGHSGV